MPRLGQYAALPFPSQRTFLLALRLRSSGYPPAVAPTGLLDLVSRPVLARLPRELGAVRGPGGIHETDYFVSDERLREHLSAWR